MKKTFLSIILLVAFGLGAQCQNQPKKARIQVLLTLMREDSMMSKMVAPMVAYMSHTQNMLSDEDSAASTKRMKAGMEKAMQRMKKIMNEDMVDIYDKHYTSKEIEDYITFYQSASGQKMLAETPGITDDLMKVMAVKYQPYLMQDMQDAMKDAPSSNN